MPKMLYNWKEADEYLGQMPDTELAERFGIPRRLVANRRRNKGIPVMTLWGLHSHLLGTMTDVDLGKLLGKRANTVTLKRRRMGIEPFLSRREREVEDNLCRTLAQFERQVKTPYGIIDVVTDTDLYECKVSLGVREAHKAIGQLLCYSIARPNRDLHIVCRKVKLSPKMVEAIHKMGFSIIVLP